MRFILDENVPQAVADMLLQHGHQPEWIWDHVPPGSADPLVATVSEELDAILVSFDGDFQKIAPRIPKTERTRFRKLSCIHMHCGEPQAAQRLRKALDLVMSEHALARTQSDQRMNIWISKSFIRTNR